MKTKYVLPVLCALNTSIAFASHWSPPPAELAVTKVPLQSALLFHRSIRVPGAVDSVLIKAQDNGFDVQCSFSFTDTLFERSIDKDAVFYVKGVSINRATVNYEVESQDAPFVKSVSCSRNHFNGDMYAPQKVWELACIVEIKILLEDGQDNPPINCK